MKFVALILLLCTFGLIAAESEKDDYLKARLSKSLKRAKGERKKFKELLKPDEKFKKAVKDAKAKQTKTESTGLRRNLESGESSEEMIPIPENWRKYVGKLPVQRYRPNTDCSGTVSEWTFYDVYGSDECVSVWDMEDQQYYSWYWFCSGGDDDVTIGKIVFDGQYCDGMPLTAILEVEGDTCEVLREDYPPYYPDYEGGFFMIGSQCSNKDKYDVLKGKDTLVLSYYGDKNCESKPIFTNAFRGDYCYLETSKKGFKYRTYRCDPDSNKMKVCEYTDPDCSNRKKCWKMNINGNLPSEAVTKWDSCDWDPEEEEWVSATCKVW